MKRKLQITFNSRIKNTLLLCAILVFNSSLNYAQTTIVSDDFNRPTPITTPVTTTLIAGGTPLTNYTTTLSGIATSTTVVTTAPDYRLQIINGVTAGTAGKTFAMASMPVTSNYKTTLHQNSGLVTWAFNMRHNRSSGTTMNGFGAGQWGVATVIACDNADPTAATAKGYAVIMGGTNNVSTSTYDLVSFSNGLNVNTNITSIITGISLVWKAVASIKVTYNPGTNKWNMYQKDEGSAVTATAYPDPSALSVAAIGEVVDTAGHVDAALPNFGFLYSHGTTLNNSYWVDNYKVMVGSVTSTTYYLAANSNCAVLNNWGTNTNGTGTNPTDFAAANQIFNIFNTGATIGADWTVNGSGSKVVLGNGTTANSLAIPATAFLNGKIDLAASSSLTISHVTTLPTLNLISPTSSVNYNGAADQVIQTGSYGNLTINTVGVGNTSGAISAFGNLTISSASTLNMGANKLLGAGTVSGSGVLKTQYSSSSAASAFPADINWPFSVFYNSITSVQSIVQGTYTNLDITGGGNRNLLAAVITVSGTLSADGAPFNSGSSVINLNGTSAQAIGNDFPGFAMKISNSSTSGVSLTASDKILDATNLELAGNLSSGGFSETFGTLSLTNNSIINLGSGSHNIAFANSGSEFWDLTKTLTIKGWTGTAGATGSNGKVFVGTDATGLSNDKLGKISFSGYSGATILTTGEVVPTSSLGTQKQDFVNFKYYPNPVVESITLSHTAAITKVAVYNLLGQKVLASKPNAVSTKLDMSGLSPSTYFIEVTSEGNKGIFKVIKK